MGRERAGLARALIIFFAGLAAAAMILAVLNDPFNSMVATSQSLTETQQAAQGRQWMVSFWDALPVIIVLLALLQLLGAAAVEGRLPGQ